MYEGWTVPIEYDPLLAKLMGYGETRDDAINRLRRALYEYFVGGIKTNISLFRRILKDPDFRAGKIDTGFLERLLASPAVETDERRPSSRRWRREFSRLWSRRRPFPAQTESAANGDNAVEEPSNWRRTSREEGLRAR